MILIVFCNCTFNTDIPEDDIKKYFQKLVYYFLQIEYDDMALFYSFLSSVCIMNGEIVLTKLNVHCRKLSVDINKFLRMFGNINKSISQDNR